MDLTSVGKRVRALRLEKKLTQPGLASLAKLHKNTVHNLEKGLSKSIETGTLEGLASALGVTVAELFSEPKPSRRKKSE